MNLTQEQLAQCRAEFESWWENNWNNGMDKKQCLEGWQATWRPRQEAKLLTVEKVQYVTVRHGNIHTLTRDPTDPPYPHEQRITALESMLRELEWNSEYEECPICLSLKEKGHDHDCRLKKLLERES